MSIIKKHKHLLFLITYTVILMYTIFNLDKMKAFISNFISIISPVLYGLVFAFLVGLISKSIRPFIKKVIKKNKTINTVSIILGYIIFFGIIVGFFLLVIPQLYNSLQDISVRLPYFYYKFLLLVESVSMKLDLNSQQITSIEVYLASLYDKAYVFISSNLPQIISYAFNFVTFIKNLGFGIVISVYILFTRNKLAIQTKKLITVILPEKVALKTLQTASRANKVFSQYISAQVIVSVILGIVCYVCMLIFRMPYALLVSIIIGVTNIVPIVGPIIGCIPSTFFVMIDNPMSGLWFLLLVIVLQQLEANVLSPKIVGDSVGMSGLWVMVAIILGGGLFGVFGMIIAVPTMGVIYALIGESVNKRYDPKFDEYVQTRSKDKKQ